MCGHIDFAQLRRFGGNIAHGFATLGAIGFEDRTMLDDKLMLNDEYRYHGVKGGTKTRLEGCIVASAPALRELLKWAKPLDNSPI